MNHKQTSVDLMGEHLFNTMNQHKEVGNIQAIYDEWVVDGQDPEDGEYEFLFINDLTVA